MSKPAFCICDIHVDSTIHLLPRYEIKPLTILCGFTAQLMSDIVGNPEDRFYRDEANVA